MLVTSNLDTKQGGRLAFLCGILSCLINMLVMVFFLSQDNFSETAIVAISRILVAEVLVCSVSWISMKREVISPFMLFYWVAYVFCAGQSVCWSFGVDMGEMDLMTYIPLIPKEYLVKALLFSAMSLSLLFLGGVIGSGRDGKRSLKTGQSLQNTAAKCAFRQAATYILIVAVPCAVVYLSRTVLSVAAGGYGEVYADISSYSKGELFLPLMAGWVPAALLIKYVLCKKDNETASRAALFCLFIYILVKLYIGGRSEAVMILLTLLLCKQYFCTPLKGWQVIPLLVVGYFCLALLNVIADARLLANRSFLTYVELLIASSGNVMGSFLGELGWSLSSVAWTMQLIDGGESYRYGTSYLFSITAIIPNLGFWEVHPATLYSDLSGWMQGLLGRSTGLGYTFMAESYANFSWAGIFVSFAIGLAFGKLYGDLSRRNADCNFTLSISAVLFMAILLKSFVRSTMSAIMRPLVFSVLLIIVFSLMFRRRYHRQIAREEASQTILKRKLI